MPHEPRDHALVWLEYALADLAITRIPLPADSRYEVLLFHAQQAVEKSLKAVLVFCEIDFPFTHNLGRLVELIPAEYCDREILLPAIVLTDYAAFTRYPGETAPIQKEQYDHLHGLAEPVFTWAKQVIFASDQHTL